MELDERIWSFSNAIMKTKTSVGLIVAMGIMFACGGCVQETVTDGSGTVIYQKPRLAKPFQSEAEHREEIMENERALGW